MCRKDYIFIIGLCGKKAIKLLGDTGRAAGTVLYQCPSTILPRLQIMLARLKLKKGDLT